MAKTYTGLTALERMKESWIVRQEGSSFAYKWEKNHVVRLDLNLLRNGATRNVRESDIGINYFFNNTFIDWVDPFEEGAPVKVTLEDVTYYGTLQQYGHTADLQPYVKLIGLMAYFNADKAERITEEELVAAKRIDVFKLASRKLDEFRIGDMVEYKGVNAIVRSVQGLYLVLTGEYSGHVKAEDVTPFKFASYVYATAPVLSKKKTEL
ncbi:hypothetical protein [Bacillus phage PK16]|nr:hypothetical protein [Bacillus phage PK16]AUM59014.1 hypothetical protein BCP01_213 [Bacillus phage BCP01]